GGYNSNSSSSGNGNTINNFGTFTGDINGSQNQGISSIGGGNTINNSDTVNGDIYGSYNSGDSSSGGSNTINNYNRVNGTIYGGYNSNSSSSGSGNTINNFGTVTGDINGSQNQGISSIGGGNTINNSGTVDHDIYGSYNSGDSSSGGSNTINNYGTVDCITGSHNFHDNSSGGGNTIVNYGTVNHDIYGTNNQGTNSSSTGNTIINRGTVGGSIYGSYNEGGSSSGGNDTIVNSGTVLGNIYAEDGDDVVIMETGPDRVDGVIDGGAGTDKIVYGGGTWTLGDAKVINFESFAINATADLTLNGNWDVAGDIAQVNGGSLTVNGRLNTGRLVINSGSAFIKGDTTVAGDVTNSGSLTVGTDGRLSAGSLDNSGTTVISGDTTVTGGVTNSGGLNVGGRLNAGSLNNSGSANIDGSAAVAGGVTNSGKLNINGTLSAGSMNNSGSANINGSATVAGGVNSSGNLNVGGTLKAGSLNNAGDAYISGRADISGSADNSGILIVNGDLTAASLSNSGAIGGAGTIHANLINSGIISPGNSIDTLTVASAVTFEPGSTLQAEIASDFTCDLLAVSGPVTINGGAISTSLPQALYAKGASWEVISAGGGLSGVFDTIEGQPDSEVLSLYQVNSGASLSLVIDRKSYGSFAAGGAADTGRGLDGLVPLVEGDMENLLLAMDWNMDARQIEQTVSATNPEMYTGFSAASLMAGGLFDGALSRRLEELRQRRAFSLDHRRAVSGPVMVAAAEAIPVGQVEPNAPQGWGLWADQEAADGYLGRGQATAGAALGADYAVSHWLVLGLATGATRSDVSWSRGDYDGEIDALHTGFYAQAGFDRVFARLLLSYARLSNSATRPVSLPGYSADAKADFDADLYAAGLAVGYQARFGAWLLEPVAGLNYQRIEEQGFSEGGAGFLNMDIADRDTDSLLFNLGLRATRLIQVSGCELLPRLGIAWQHQLGDERPSLEASFIDYGSAPFTVNGAEFSGDTAVAELGLSAALESGLELFADYRLAWADDYLAQSLSAGLMYRF
ncbi:MAG: autotransporter domain-containing protein, partial [Desulfarculaceae bacterium]